MVEKWHVIEKKFEDKVKKFLKEKNIWYLKTWGNSIQKAGVPDLLVCLLGRFIAIELKSETGDVSELQKVVIKRINESGGCAFILRPKGFEEFKRVVEAAIARDIKMKAVEECLKQIKF